MAMAEVLERLGHEVEYPERQTCCGQPAFNSGYWKEARTAAGHFLDVFGGAEMVVAPSGSCTAMVKSGFGELFKGTEREREAASLGGRTHEFSEFLVKVLNVVDLGARFPGRFTFHDGCHSLREIGVKTPPRELLKWVKELELVEMAGAERCCGFGGTFAVKHPDISTAMGRAKCADIVSTKADFVVSNDPSCLLQVQSVIDKKGLKIRALHLAEVLASR
jgi:L-lactate dehydrogenase complex protein LldE